MVSPLDVRRWLEGAALLGMQICLAVDGTETCPKMAQAHRDLIGKNSVDPQQECDCEFHEFLGRVLHMPMAELLALAFRKRNTQLSQRFHVIVEGRSARTAMKTKIR